VKYLTDGSAELRSHLIADSFGSMQMLTCATAQQRTKP
jgi:hypothetical protein